MKKFIYRILIIINFAAIAPLLISYLAIYVNPSKIWIISLFGLGYPYLLIVNVFFVLFWMYHKRWAFLYSFVIIVLGWTYVSRTVQINFGNEQKIIGEQFEILSYNVRHFDKYNWTENKATPNLIADFISDKKANIVCLQEIASNSRKGIKNHPQLKKLTKNKNTHFDYAKSKSGRKTTGIITYSTYPIINKGVIRFEGSNNLAIFSDIKINTDIIRVFNLHLQSIKIDPRDYSMLDSLNLSDRNKNIKEAEDILGHLKKAFKIRARQAEKIAEEIKNSPYPVVVCGDFNDSPISYSYQTIRNNLLDAFIESGTGISNTYRGKFPSVRIDYILHSDRIYSSGYKKSNAKLSDHYPISCELSIKQ